MIKHDRIAEILHQAATEDIFRKVGEKQAYEDFMMNVSPDENMAKIHEYIQDEVSLAELAREESVSYESWTEAKGRLDAYDKLKEAIKKYGSC